jgi:hypothetical protein
MEGGKGGWREGRGEGGREGGMEGGKGGWREGRGEGGREGGMEGGKEWCMGGREGRKGEGGSGILKSIRSRANPWLIPSLSRLPHMGALQLPFEADSMTS